MNIIDRINKYNSHADCKIEMELPHYDQRYISLEIYEAIFSSGEPSYPLIRKEVLSPELCNNIIDDFPNLKHFDRTYQGNLDLDLRGAVGAFLPKKILSQFKQNHQRTCRVIS